MDDSWLRCSSFTPSNLPTQAPASGAAPVGVDRTALLAAAEGLLSSSEDSDGSSASQRSRSPPQQQQASRGSKKDKQHKKHKKHKRGSHSSSRKRRREEAERDVEKMRRIEQRLGGASGQHRQPSSTNGAPLLFASSLLPGSSQQPEVVLDTRGDKQNLVYQSLHAKDIPRYHRLDPLNLVKPPKWNRQHADKDTGASTIDRYFRGRHVMADRNRATKRLHLADLRTPAAAAPAGAAAGSSSLAQPLLLLTSRLPGSGAVTSSSSSASELSLPEPSYIPLAAETSLGAAAAAGSGGGGWRDAGGGAGDGLSTQQQLDPYQLVAEAGETGEQLVLRLTRAWNVALRERPHQEQLWLDYVAWQEEAARLLGGRRATDAAAVAERQASILKRGLQHHPGSPRLLLALMRAAAASGVDAADPAALLERWQAVLQRHPGSWLLWREYLSMRCRQYSSYKVTALQDGFADAIADLYRTKQRLQRSLQQQQQQQGAGTQVQTPAVTAGDVMRAEGCLVLVVLGLLQLLLEAGQTEQAVARIQALLEFHCCAPPAPPGAGGTGLLLRWFRGFWDSGAPRLGQPKAAGWAAWCLGPIAAGGLRAVAAAGGGVGPPAAPPPPPPPPAAAAGGAAAAAGGEMATVEPPPEVPQQEAPGGGWSGWFEAPAADEEALPPLLPPTGDSGDPLGPPAGQRPQPPGSKGATPSGAASGSDSEASSGDTDGQEAEAAQQKEEEEGQMEQQEVYPADLDEGDLMIALGVELEDKLLEVEQQGLPPEVMRSWAAQEQQRSLDCWQPLPEDHPGVAAAAAAGELDPSCLVGFADVEGVLFGGLTYTATKRHLLLGVLESLGVPLGTSGSSNTPTPQQQQRCRAPDVVSHLPLLLRQRRLAAAAGGRGGTWASAAEAALGLPTAMGGESAAGSGSQQGTAAALYAAGVLTPPGLGPFTRCLEDLVLTSSTALGSTVLGSTLGSPLGAPGAGAAAAAAAAGAGTTGGPASGPWWWSGSKARWSFVLQLLESLVTHSSVSAWPELTHAYIQLAASEPHTSADPSGGGGAGGGVTSSNQQALGTEAWPNKQQLAAGRAAAKRLMAAQQQVLQQQQQQQGSSHPGSARLLQLRGHLQQLVVAEALGALEAAGGNQKAARKTLTASLTAALKLLASCQASAAAGTKAGPSSSAGSSSVVAAILAGAAATSTAAASAAAGEGSGSAAVQEAAVTAAVAGTALMLALRLADVEFQAAADATLNSSSSTPAGSMLAGCFGSACAALADALTGQTTAMASGAVSPEHLAQARRALQQNIPQLVQVAGGALDAHVGALVTAAAALELLHGAAQGRPQQGAAAASALVRNICSSAPAAVRASSVWCEKLAVWQCGVLVTAATHSFPWSLAGGSPRGPAVGGSSSVGEVVTPAAARVVLAEALDLYPGNHKLLELLLVLSVASCSRAQVRVALQQLLEVAPSAAAWGVVLAGEMAGGALQGMVGRQQVKVLLEKALGNPSLAAHQKQRSRQELLQEQAAKAAAAGPSEVLPAFAADGSSMVLYDPWYGCAHVAQLWRLYMHWEAAAGRLEAARKVLLRGLHACPGAKQLWLEGLGGAVGDLTPVEAKGLMGALEEREVLVRVDVMEVVLQHLDQQGLPI